MTSARIRTARGLLNWNVQELGKRAGRSANERGITGGRPETLKAIQKALERLTGISTLRAALSCCPNSSFVHGIGRPFGVSRWVAWERNWDECVELYETVMRTEEILNHQYEEYRKRNDAGLTDQERVRRVAVFAHQQELAGETVH